MASIYEKVPLYKVVKAWVDNNPNQSEVYKLQSSDLRNKSRVKIHKDNGKYGIKFTINKMIPEFNKGAGKCDLNWSDSFVEFENVLQGHRLVVILTTSQRASTGFLAGKKYLFFFIRRNLRTLRKHDKPLDN